MMHFNNSYVNENSVSAKLYPNPPTSYKVLSAIPTKLTKIFYSNSVYNDEKLPD